MAKYRKKPVEIEAVQLRWDTWSEVCDFITLPWGPDGVHGVYTENGVITDDGNDRLGLVIPTPEGDHLAAENDFIIKGINSEFYPCKPDVFQKTYEPVDQFDVYIEDENGEPKKILSNVEGNMDVEYEG